jgi:condensin complex subunit 2
MENNGQGVREKPKAKVGSKMSSNRLNAVSTIEKNASLLNIVKLEHDYAFDPSFQKLSKAFDEGGARGMLLYNMVSEEYYYYIDFV